MYEDQSGVMQSITKLEINKFREELEFEHGPFTTQDLPTGRVLLIPEAGEPYVCYMSDPTNDARLIVDDYVPELGIDLEKGR